MGNAKSDAGAEKFFNGVGGLLEKGGNQFITTLSMPQQMMQTALNGAKGATDFLTSPLGGLMIPIIAIGGLYIASIVLKK